MFNKRGQEAGGISVVTVLIIALAILLIIGFVLYNTSSTFRSYVQNIAGGGSNNIASIITGCESACETGNTYGYCTEKRDVRYPKDLGVSGNRVTDNTCDQLSKRTDVAKLMFSCSKAITCS